MASPTMRVETDPGRSHLANLWPLLSTQVHRKRVTPGERVCVLVGMAPSIIGRE